MSAKKPNMKPGPNKNKTPKGSGMKPPKIPGKTAGFWALLVVLVFLVYQMIYIDRSAIYDITYSAFQEQVEQGNIAEYSETGLNITGLLREKTTLTVIDGTLKEVDRFHTRRVDLDMALWVGSNNPEVVLKSEAPKVNWWDRFLIYYLPFLLILVLWLFFLRQMQGGGNKAFSFGKSKAKLFNMDKPEITFEDVAGCDEAKYELEEIIDFLRAPEKFQRLGGRIPKGALLVGSPGTGKTLLGKAVAGEAGVPFFSMSGSDFVEMFVGVGASRVRDLFDQGKKNAPCIIFIDEIDAVGRHRGAGLGGGHDEREQTLNQLLVEMDGFEANDGVILLAATNRPDVLDPALLRPGRFDRQIVVDMPDIVGREAILRVHIKKIRIDDSVSPKVIASGTPGMAGADLENLVNEAALLAARKNHERVTMDDFEDAKEKVMLGPERRSRVIPDKLKREIAYHEAGHAVVADNVEEAFPVHKVTIISRGQALGLTHMLPTEDQFTTTQQKFLDNICVALGGRVAEEIFLGKIGSGASGDIKSVTYNARTMVTRMGMSEILGPIAFEQGNQQVFLGRDYAQHHGYSEKTKETIDSEINRIVNEQLIRAREILEIHRDKVEKVTAVLLERETLDAEEFRMVMDGQELPDIVIEVDHSTDDKEPAAETPAEPQKPEVDEAPEATTEGKADEPAEADEPEEDDNPQEK